MGTELKGHHGSGRIDSGLEVISIAPYLIDKDGHTPLYKTNKNECTFKFLLRLRTELVKDRRQTQSRADKGEAEGVCLSRSERIIIGNFASKIITENIKQDGSVAGRQVFSGPLSRLQTLKMWLLEVLWAM